MNEVLGNALFAGGATGLFVGYYMALRLAFEQSSVFGWTCLLVGIVLLYFLLTRPKTNLRPLAVLICSFASVVIGYKMLNA